MSPEITFIVPAYHIAEYLPDCLNSILAVPVAKEIIVIDDGSSDNTPAVAQTFFQQNDCITLLSQHNQGVSAARNRGIALARGKFVQFVDADDILRNQSHYPDWLRFADEQGIDVVKTLIQWIELGGAHLKTQTPYFDHVGEAYVCHAHDYWHQMLLTNWFPSAVNGFYRTELLQSHHIRFPVGISHSEDALFFADVMNSQSDVRVLELNAVGYAYRHRMGSASHATDSNLRGFISTLHVIHALWQRRENAAQQQQKQPENTYWHTVYASLKNTIAVQFITVYERQYHLFNEREKAHIRSYVSVELLDLVRPFSQIEIVV